MYAYHTVFMLVFFLQMVTEHLEVDSEGQMQLSDNDEEDLCRVWDMAMDKVTHKLTYWYE